MSNRNGSSQLFYVPSDGSDRDVVQLTNFPIPITSFKVSRNYIMFSADVYLSCNDFQCTADRDKEAAKNPNAGVVYDSLFIRHWDTWKTPGKVSHVFLHKIEKIGSSYRLTGNPVDLMRNLNADSPVPPFGGNDHYDISPTENHVAFTAALVTHDSSWNTGWKTFIVDISNFPRVEEPIPLSTTLARTQNPVFSKSGKYIAYLSMDRPGYEADRLHLVVYNVAARVNTPITNHIDISLSGIAWSASDEIIFADLDLRGNHALIAIYLTNLRIQLLVQNGTVSTPVVLNDDKVVYTHNDHLGPNEIYTFRYNGNIPLPTKITQANPDFSQLFELRPAERFAFTSTGNVTVYGYFFYPYRWKNDGTKYPIVQLIHGGPQGSWTNGWSTRWNPQLFAANGYAVVTIDPRGSTGYGQNFTDAVNGDWGGRPFEDLMNGLDYVLRKYDWIDTERQFACGASYGGYMINWIQGNTNRYKALVNHDGLFDLEASYYSTEELWFFEWEFGAPPYINDTLYKKWTPSQYVSRWRTPMLIIHGSLDFRIDETQGLSAFTALQRRGIESRFLLFPEENHWVLNPGNSIQWYDEVLGWLDEHL